jgi:hypothetical protein
MAIIRRRCLRYVIYEASEHVHSGYTISSSLMPNRPISILEGAADLIILANIFAEFTSADECLDKVSTPLAIVSAIKANLL